MINLTHQNHCGILPATSIGNNQYKLDPGWTIIGTQPSPWKSATGSTALVLEKTTPPTDTHDYHQQLEPGYYWIHIKNDTCPWTHIK